MGCSEGVIVICALFFPLCSCQLEEGGSQSCTINNSSSPEFPLLQSTAPLTRAAYSTGLHPFQLFSSTVGERWEWTAGHGYLKGLLSKEFRISLQLNELKARLALVPSLQLHCTVLFTLGLWHRPALTLFFTSRQSLPAVFFPAFNVLPWIRYHEETPVHTKLSMARKITSTLTPENNCLKKR